MTLNLGGELNCSQVKSIPWSESETSSIKSMTSNKTAGGAHLLLVTDKNELLSTSLRNNTTQKIKMPSSIVPEEVSFVTTNRNQAIIISKFILVWPVHSNRTHNDLNYFSEIEYCNFGHITVEGHSKNRECIFSDSRFCLYANQ